ncbi:MAG: DUF2442 domain-containing protein [Chloroflexaceae bacterium]|nr:DUF2442 domain-containing protein [Chloroflexaceae bacterium]
MAGLVGEGSPEKREQWTIEPGGYAIYWEDLDDGIEIRHLLSTKPLMSPRPVQG